MFTLMIRLDEILPASSIPLPEDHFLVVRTSLNIQAWRILCLVMSVYLYTVSFFVIGLNYYMYRRCRRTISCKRKVNGNDDTRPRLLSQQEKAFNCRAIFIVGQQSRTAITLYSRPPILSKCSFCDELIIVNPAT